MVGARAVPSLCHKMADSSLSLERKTLNNSDKTPQRQQPSSTHRSLGPSGQVLSRWQTHAGATGPVVSIGPSLLAGQLPG